MQLGPRRPSTVGWPEEPKSEYNDLVSPTVFRAGRFRFFFFSREEPRIHVHVLSPDGEAKYWVEPAVELAKNYGLNASDLGKVEALIKEHQEEIRDAWQRHFGS